ncbi:hypothetical protein MXG72_004817 [Salmonella enterica]|nr:hypothetical protein [Salmonella enterica]
MVTGGTQEDVGTTSVPCCPEPVRRDQRRPWNNEPTVPIVGELMPRKRLEGRALKCGWMA